MNESGDDARYDRLPLQTVRRLAKSEADRVRRWAAGTPHHYVEVELSGAAGKSAVLAAIARAFAFPEWFGMNLDALYDALTDLPADGGYVILLDQLTRTADFNAERRAALLDVFRDAARELAERSVPFRVFYS